MSDSILNDYKAYYKAKAERYAGNENYINSYNAEMRLSEAMQSCNELEEFRSKIGNLNDQCSIALVKDESILEQKHYIKHQEIFRVKASQRVLEKIDSCSTSLDIATMVVEETNKTSVEISMDEAHREFISDWDMIDEISVYEKAVVPDNYKSKMMEIAADIKKSLNESVISLEKNNHEWQSNWKLVPDMNLEHRHLRLIPFSDEHIREQLSKYKSIINR